MWIGPDGAGRAVRFKGGPLFDALHGIDTAGSRDRHLSAAPADLARAYSSAVWAYRCIKLRADAVAGVPLALIDRSGARISEHPVLALLRDVNPHTMNLSDLLRATEAAYNIWGVAYWLKIRRPGTSRVQWLAWLNPQTVEAVKDSVRGVTGYRQQVGREVREVAAGDVIAFRNFDPLDDLGGLSPLSVALSEVNAELNAARFVAAFFANDARPAGLLTTDQMLHEADIERVQTWWERLFGGVRSRWKTGILGGGLKWQQITFPPADLALGDLRAEDRRAICAVFGVPPGLAGAWESTTYATAREQKASFYEDTILPQLNYIAEALNWSLLPHYPDLTARGARLTWDVDSIAALRESAGERAGRLVRLFETGILSRNEVRSQLGLAPLPDDGFTGGDAPASSHEPATPAGPQPQDAARSVRGELGQWHRFAVKRVRAGKPLRAFRSAAIPPALQAQVEAALAQARTVEDVSAVFSAAQASAAAAVDQGA
jgi:HK97 family phage portal protein